MTFLYRRALLVLISVLNFIIRLLMMVCGRVSEVPMQRPWSVHDHAHELVEYGGGGNK
jgi:hypothetical protein